MALLRKMTLVLLCFLMSVHFGYSQTVCPAGSYGPSCLLDCDNTCVTDGCTVTDADTCGCDKDTGRCSKCISGYYTDECDVLCVPGCDGACARSTGNCEKCVSQTYGDKCDLNCNNCPYGCDQVSGTCLSGCQVENCMSCVESITTCDYCTDGYGLDEDGTTCCSDGCISQDTNGYPECQPHTGLCKYSNCKGEQFYGEYCQRCNTRIPNCETCGLDTVTDTLECLTCSPPYVPTSTGASCCPEGCESCDELICTSCKPGWFLYDTRCDTCGDYCTPPSDGSERCDSVTGGCLFGCLTGWHGSACDVECTIGYCNTCAYDEANNDLTCADCADTWYGDQCASCFNLQCDPAGECDQNGVCQGDCQPGYRGATCVERCDAVAGMENCDECHRTDQLCTLCKPGYFGPTCGEACSENCVADNFGDQKCDLDTGACDLQCDPGYWQADCRIACPNCASGSCNITSGYCQPKVCSQGFYGVMCNQPCPEECANNPNTLQLECDVDTGVCTHGCAYNFYGDFCNNYCHENCSTKNFAGDMVGTDEPLCSQSDGACLYGCVNGSYTPQCSKSCISSCVWDYCDITSGICQACHDNPPGWHCINADCPSGKHDKYCDEQCHPNCVDTCARYSSFCDACRVGWHGENCQTQCGECSGSSCFQYNGTCQSECNNRFYGETCNSRCPDDTCNYCNRETGICETCQPGLWGTTCDQSCSTSCEPSTDGLLYCDIGTGDCGIKTCRPGYWGSDCRANCPAHCRPDIDDSLRYCNFSTGACLDTGCDSGWFGEFCNIRCSPTCTGNICDRDGQCDFDLGCIDKYYGFDCSNNCKETCNDDTCDRSDGECAECNKTLAERTPLCRTADCPSGFREVYCTETCPDYCLDSCDRYNSTCRECVMGWHGDTCQHKCRECSGISCFQNNGTCQSHCNDGYYGYACDITCPDEFCKSCKRETGECSICQSAQWGTTCDEKCSVGCEPSIDGHVYCDIGTGVCDIQSCLPGYWSSDCQGNCPVHCRPSSDSLRYCNFSTGGCLDTGCDSGWFGEFCNITCSSTCRGNICDRDGKCDDALGCQEYYYGIDCSSNCKETCNDNTCDRIDGECAACNKTLAERAPLCRSAACPPPKKGLMCNENCPDECFGGICQRYNSTCESCNDGFYGDFCQEDCGACVDNICNQETGVCDKQCRPGYYGDKCENICLHPGCYTCDHLTGECTECKATKYGENCDESCSSFCLESNDGQIYCDRDNGDCVENACAPGYHMPTCIRSCNDNCFPDQNGDKPCDIDDGSCDLGCAMYYYGDQCNQECSGNCLAGTCQRDGDCIGGCKTGFFASDCELTCSLKLTCTDRTCDIDTGKCAECDEPDRTHLCREADCPVGLWGEFCNETCPSNCADNKCRREGGSCIGCDVTYYGSDCDERCFYCVNDVCIQNDGTCEQGCVDGYYGQQCITPCLYLNCKDCTRTTGVCITCEPGYYGVSCDRECSPFCEDPATCSKDDGTCDSDTCVPGYWSPQCKESCSPYCNTNQGECDKTSGACAPCVRGYFNVDCTGFCTDRCKDSNCELRADNCIDGCRDGYWGNLCERPCSPNCEGLACHVSTSACLFGCDADRYYGDTCSTECNANCDAGVCNTTGYCTLGCAKGSHGDMCDLQCAEVSKCTDGTCDRRKGICSICDADPKNILCPQADCNPGLWGNECGKQCASQLCLYNQCHRYDNVCKGCGTGDYGLYCNKSCGHCQTNSGCDQISGTCDQGCSAGWRGDMCMTPCDPLCQTCDRDTGACIACVARRWGLDCEEDCSSHCAFSPGNVYCEKDTGHCQSCEAGYWRPACTDTCPDNCKASDLGDKICTIDNGYCSNGCQLTYYGDRCQLSCSTRCRNQLCVGAQDTCVDGCADGYWGPQCTHQCSSHCGVPGSCSPTDGACYDDCEDGHYGRLCDSECIATCKDGKCDEQGSCPECRVIPIGSGCRVQVCELGFYGHLCEEECPGAYCQNNMCHRLDGDCEDGCLLGYYGLYCTQQCRCDNDGTDECTQTLGECVCKTGRKGIICDEYCSDGCVNRQCSSITGECEFGCNAGRYGPECESSCDNCAGQNCDANSGLCPGDCNVGWYGSRCEQTCLATCPLCDKNSGRCLTCDVDKYGDMCQSTCSDTCAPVAGDRTCRQTDGQCVAGCLAGYYGDFCDKACDNCYDGGACDSNGVCTQGCEAGWWGTKCDEVCGENCARGGSRYEATCRYETGVCDYDCVAGYYGDLCLNPCSDQCLNKVCSALNQCTSGCVTGYYGPGCTSQCEYCQNGACQQGTGNCQDGCQQGRWGPRCTSVCTQTCTNDECDPTYGDCRDCLVTPQGSGCRDIDTGTAAPSTTDELATGAVIGIAAGAVGIVIIFVVLFVYCVVYKRKAHDAKQEIHLPSDLLERMSTMRSHHSTVSSQYPVARVIGDDEKDFAMF